jgi:hypothetical protein
MIYSSGLVVLIILKCLVQDRSATRFIHDSSGSAAVSKSPGNTNSTHGIQLIRIMYYKTLPTG